MKQTMKKFILSLLLLFGASLIISCTFAPYEEEDDKQYIIGSVGQGGIIFYDKGYYIDGWRYLEVSHDNIESIKLHCWIEPSIITTATNTAVGTGKTNTSIIVNQFYSNGDCAAKICDDYTISGYDDWFLPSIDELYHLYLNKIGGLSTFYWSSSDSIHNSSAAWLLDFTTGIKSFSTPKNSKVYVRAVRTF